MKMENQHQLSRRRFISLSALGIGSASLLTWCTPPKVSAWRFFTEEESKLIEAIVDQIIPPDEFSGGRDAGVANFIDKQLSGTYQRFQADYRKGLGLMQQSCKSSYHKRFEELDGDTRNQFLTTMEAGKLDGEGWKQGFDSSFFRMLRDHSMQGFYGSPRHGGNKNYVSYKMIKLDYPFIIGQNRYKI